MNKYGSRLALGYVGASGLGVGSYKTYKTYQESNKTPKDIGVSIGTGIAYVPVGMFLSLIVPGIVLFEGSSIILEECKK